MNPIDRLADFTRSFMTVNVQPCQQQERIEETRADVRQLGDKVNAPAERVTRLEGTNENDRIRIAPEFDRFKLAAERVLVREQNPGILPPIREDIRND